jgi:hypothetical protein
MTNKEKVKAIGHKQEKFIAMVGPIIMEELRTGKGAIVEAIVNIGESYTQFLLKVYDMSEEDFNKTIKEMIENNEI